MALTNSFWTATAGSQINRAQNQLSPKPNLVFRKKNRATNEDRVFTHPVWSSKANLLGQQIRQRKIIATLTRVWPKSLTRVNWIRPVIWIKPLHLQTPKKTQQISLFSSQNRLSKRKLLLSGAMSQKRSPLKLPWKVINRHLWEVYSGWWVKVGWTPRMRVIRSSKIRRNSNAKQPGLFCLKARSQWKMRD